MGHFHDLSLLDRATQGLGAISVNPNPTFKTNPNSNNIKGAFDWPYSVYFGIRIKFQNSLLIRRTIKYPVNSNDMGERYNLVVLFF